MKITYLSLFAIVFIAVACQNAKSSQAKEEVKDTVQIPQKQIRNSDLAGVWKIEGKDENENPDFEIKPDSIFYIDHLLTLALKTKSDSIYIYYPSGWIRRFFYELDDGVLVMKDTANRTHRYMKVE